MTWTLLEVHRRLMEVAWRLMAIARRPLEVTLWSRIPMRFCTLHNYSAPLCVDSHHRLTRPQPIRQFAQCSQVDVLTASQSLCKVTRTPPPLVQRTLCPTNTSVWTVLIWDQIN